MSSLTKVFIAGSRRLSKLNEQVKRRIDNIVDKNFAIMIGDANGVDKAIQKYLCARHYRNVVVFCMEKNCRNNVGDWPKREILAAESSRRDFAYYSTKDQVMVQEADYGFMLWDGQSRGTLRSIVDLVQREKPVIVYVASEGAFHTLRRPKDLRDILTLV